MICPLTCPMRRISMTVIIIMILEVYLLKFFVSANKFDRLITIADMARIVWPISYGYIMLGPYHMDDT